MNIEKLIETRPFSDVKENKVFEYPFLFDISYDDTTDISIVQQNIALDADCIFESLQPVSLEKFSSVFQFVYISSTDETNQDNFTREWKETVFETNQVENVNQDISNITYDPIILHNVRWIMDSSKINILSDEFAKILEQNMVPVGKSFTEHPLFFGTLSTYFIQYLAYGLFGHPNAMMCINNQKQIHNNFRKLSNIMKNELLEHKTFEKFAERMRRIFIENAPERWERQHTNNIEQIPFEEGDILEFYVRIYGKIHVPNSFDLIEDTINETWKQIISSSTICDKYGNLNKQIWKVRFILI